MAFSTQQTGGLAFSAVCSIIFGGAILACGLIFQYHDDYNDGRVNGMGKDGGFWYYTQYWLGAPYHDDYNDVNGMGNGIVNGMVNGMVKDGGFRYYYTQYWLGAPLIILGVVILITLCVRAKAMLYVCMVLSSLILTLAITAVVLEGPKWRYWLSIRQLVLDVDEHEENGICTGVFHLGLSCQEVFYATLMQSVVVACSILAIVLSQCVMFISVRFTSNTAYEVDKAPPNRAYTSTASQMNIMTAM